MQATALRPYKLPTGEWHFDPIAIGERHFLKSFLAGREILSFAFALILALTTMWLWAA